MNFRAFLIFVFVLLPNVCFADGINSGDTAWMLVSSVLVLFMTIPGLALFYGGMVRKKNILSLSMQAFATACIISLLWFFVGYSLCFTQGNAFFGDLTNIALNKLSINSLSDTIPESLFVMFQMTFAIIAPVIIVGAVVERVKFSALILFLSLWIVLVYCPICHWVWGPEGWLDSLGVLDFAGGDVIHINAGIAGLVAAMVLGPRYNYKKDNMSPHNLIYAVIGGSLLWIGWFGFNAGSAATAGKAAAMAMLVTQIATAAAGVTWMFIEWYIHKKPSLLGIISGCVAGLVAITPAAGFVDPVGGLFTGIFGSAGCYWGVTVLKRKLNIDDSLDCWGIHGIGGIIGAVTTGIFACKSIGGTPGLLEGNFMQVPIQLVGVLSSIFYSGIVSYIILKVTDKMLGLRVALDDEQLGLDLSCHDEKLG